MVEDIVTAHPILFALHPLLNLYISSGRFTGPLFRYDPLLPKDILTLLVIHVRGDYCTLLPVAVDYGLIIPVLIPISSDLAVTASAPISRFRITTGVTPERPDTAGVLAKLPGSGLVAIGNTPSVTGFMYPASGFWSPSVIPDIPRSLGHIYVNIVAVPIEVAPGAEGKPEIKTGPV